MHAANRRATGPGAAPGLHAGLMKRSEKAMTTFVNCPICAKKVEWSEQNKYRPFCSERCRQIDLGAWAAEKYTIAGKTDEENSDDSGRGDLN